MTKKIKTTAVQESPSESGTVLVPLKKQLLDKIKQLKTDLADLEKLVNSIK